MDLCRRKVKGGKTGGPSAVPRVLGILDVTLMGVGKIVGAGVFVLTGVATHRAGPAIVISYAMSSLSALFAALCYAEFSSQFPFAGSAYLYSYHSLGELPAFIIGWDLLLEYNVGAASVASGWSAYTVAFLRSIGIPIPSQLTDLDVGFANLNILAFSLILALLIPLCAGIEQSSRVNMVVTGCKLTALVLFVIAGLYYANYSHWDDFAPNGVSGIMRGAATVFYSYIGFDALSTVAEEVKNPKTTMSFGILSSLAIASILYVSVAAVLTLMVSWKEVDGESPLSSAFLDNNSAIASIISFGAVIGLVSGCFISLLAQPRVLLALARDGMCPSIFARLSSHQVPFHGTILTGVSSAFMALFFPLSLLASLVAVGTLFAFSTVSLGVLFLRYRRPESMRGFDASMCCFVVSTVCTSTLTSNGYPWGAVFLAPTLASSIYLYRIPAVLPREGSFVCPGGPTVPLLAMFTHLFMLCNMKLATWIRFLCWVVCGLTLYLLYGRRHSKLNPENQTLVEGRT